MKMVMVIGRPNDTLNEISERLAEHFVIRSCQENFSDFESMIGICPDTFVVSLIGAEIGIDLFEKLSTIYYEIPVITIGSEIERMMFIRFYGDAQFRHLNTPVSGQQVLDTVCGVLEADTGGIGRESNADGTGKAVDAAEHETTTTAADAAPPGILGIMAMMRGEREQANQAQNSQAQSAQADGGSGKGASIQNAPIQRTKIKVLVVDDDPMMLRSVKSMLDDRYQVTIATSGTKAISMIEKYRPDVILLDYEMPVCDGKRTLEMIRADEGMKNIPVIFLTGVSDKAHIYAVLALRPFGYIIKPAEKERLIETIEKAAASR